MTDPAPTGARLRFVVVDESVTDALIDGLLRVARSHPDFLASHEGSDGSAGVFDRAMLERDLAVALMDPLRHVWALRDRRVDGDDVIGWADTLDEHPTDGVPWVGLLEIRADHARRGYGREAAGAIARYYAERGTDRLRLGVDDGNQTAYAFWTALGYQEVDRRTRRGPAGRSAVLVMETELS